MEKKGRLFLALFMAFSLAFLFGASPIAWATQPQKPIILKHHDPSKAGTSRTFYIDRLVKYYDEETQMQLCDFQKAGVHLYYLTPEQLAKWKESAKPINQAYYEEMKKKGIDGQKIVTEYQALYDKYERKK